MKLAKYEDEYRHKGLRKQLVALLREKGISSEIVLNAMLEIPRHFYIESALEAHAYEDRALAISDGQTISQPYTVAYQTQLLDVQKNQKVLEIGTGSMYQASVLAHIGAKVYTIERHKTLYEKTKNFIFKDKYRNIKFFYGDGFAGLPTWGPFDKILITAAAPSIPQKLIQQLKIGGVMVVPITENGQEIMHRITKISNDDLHDEAFGIFSFVPMLEGRVHNRK